MKTIPLFNLRLELLVDGDARAGDSITAGFEYPNDLWVLLGDEYVVGNFGAGGTTIALDAPTPYMSQSTFEEAEEFSPNIVIVMLGLTTLAPKFNRNTGFSCRITWS